MKNDGHLKLKRIAPGCYQTADGKYEVIGFQRPEKCDYGPAGQWQWYFRGLPYGDVDGHYYTKREAVEALGYYVRTLAV